MTPTKKISLADYITNATFKTFNIRYTEKNWNKSEKEKRQERGIKWRKMLEGVEIEFERTLV